MKDISNKLDRVAICEIAWTIWGRVKERGSRLFNIQGKLEIYKKQKEN